ncbi:transmembrane amino acid transporter [Diaporthe helianthi]|uniref:Transmembrane amino acid transporter n=1 Tax=Diaporthe helianthi TaxID=158607 RepID=A0A2P5HF63_DIAHE|nr:transmembrane amino acid transporter [Diaporthe helianthi]
MSEKKDINQSPDDNLESGELYGVKTNPAAPTDAVFGEISEDGPNYRSLGWIGAAGLMTKSSIGLGVLSIPTVFDTLGMIPGIICLIVVGTIITWSGYVVGVFKLRHPEVYGVDDAGFLMFGRIGREVFGAAFCLYWTFIAGSGMLGTSIGLNAVSAHGTCTAVFVVVAAIVGFSFASIRTLGKISWLAWLGVGCIIISIFILAIAVGIQERPAAAPQDGIWVSDYKLTNTPDFASAVSAVSSLIFAFGGIPAYFNIQAEMADPRLYTRSLLVCQSTVSAVYITIGIVVYYYCGSYVASPALGSAGHEMKKVTYGVALPGLFVSTILTIHLPAKYIFIRVLRGSRHLTANTVTHWASWIGCTGGIAIVAYVIASGIPVFDGLVSLVGALLGTLMSFQPMGCMWLYDNWSQGKSERSVRWILMVCVSVFVVASGTFLMVAGTYGSAVGIAKSYEATGGSAAWSCADNSNS